MFAAIIQHTPLWVWGVLAALTAAGMAQLRSRDMSVARMTLVPALLTALSAAGVLSAFGRSPVAIGAWFTGLLLAGLLGRLLLAPRGASWSAATARVRVPGSWLPLALMLGLFAIKFGVGVVLAMHPGLATDAEFSVVCSLAYGTFSGLFLGRALALRAVAASESTLQPA